MTNKFNYKDLTLNSTKRAYNLLNYKATTTIEDLSNSIILYIISFIRNSNDIKNIRLISKRYYRLLKDIPFYNEYGYLSRILYFNRNKIPYKLEYYDIKFNRGTLQNYFKSECFLKNSKKHGIHLVYNKENEIVRREYYRYGKLNGPKCEYINNRLTKKIPYLDGLKNGDIVYFNDISNEMLVTKFLIDIKIEFKKYKCNILITHSQFSNNYLNGKTIIYYLKPYQKNKIKNLLTFKLNNLEGSCLIQEHDRILKLNFINGLLDGVQSVYTIEKKLKCLLHFREGKLDGPYKFFDSFKKVEEGFIQNGSFNKLLTIYNTVELSKYIYPLSYNQLDGEYIERVSLSEIRILYKRNRFVGKFMFNSIQDGESIDFQILNRNNFEYRRYKFGKELIIFKKHFGKYSLNIYNLEEESKIDELYTTQSSTQTSTIDSLLKKYESTRTILKLVNYFKF